MDKTPWRIRVTHSAHLLRAVAAAAGQGRILELIIGGEAAASAVNRVFVNRAGTSITSNTPITPEKFNSRSPVAAGTYGKAGTQALVNKAGLTANVHPGSPFVVLNIGQDNVLVPGEVAQPVFLKVTSPLQEKITYTIQAMAGEGLPP